MNLKYLFNLLMFLVLVLPGCNRFENFDDMLDALYSRSVPLIKSESVAKKLSQPEKPVVLDIRSKQEFEVSHLPGAQFIDYKNFSVRDVEDLERDKEIIVYCSVGYRSEKIGEELIELGFTDVKNIYGGIFEWKNTDHQVVDTTGNPTEKVHTYNERWSKWLIKGIKVYE